MEGSKCFSMSDDFKLEKTVWDDGDFEQMGWHDATIHGIAFGRGMKELSLDIDYIFKWVHPQESEKYFRFLVAPCTLVFQNVFDLLIEAEPSYGMDAFQIEDIHRNDPLPPRNIELIDRDVDWQWTIECCYAHVSFRSVGYKQYIRRTPVLTQAQSLDWSERGGFSFECGGECGEESA